MRFDNLNDEKNLDFVLTQYSRSLIAYKARQICRRPGFSRSDRDDVEQQLWETVVRQAPNFDPARASLDTFLDRVVDFGVRMFLRNRRRQKRANGFRAQSLDAAAPQRGDMPLGASLSDADRGRHNGAASSDEAARRETAEAVNYAFSEMPDDLCEILRRVMGGSVSSAARNLGISRRQVRNALHAARPLFERAGFGNS